MSRDQIQAYLNEIGRYPLLTKAQEILLGTQVQAWMKVLEKRKEEYNSEDLQIERIGRRAKEKFINCNLRLVVNIARKYVGYCKTLDLMDLVQEGNIGLTRAVERFDPTRGYAMSTYAYWWIRQAIQRAVQSTDASIKLPANYYDLSLKVKKIIEELSKMHGRQPTIEEIAEQCEVSIENLKLALDAPKVTVSLDKRATEEGSNCSILEFVRDPNHSNTIEDAELRINIEEVYQAMDEYLDETSKYILLERSRSPATPWRDLAKATGLSKEKLQIMEQTSIRKCALLISVKRQIEV
jgi:RNA polymerase sigma factor (sigma-70 family)